ncbi:MAG: cyclic nucleotide-binding domain-containing protein [Gammaproteobacteria bacterium]|nr:cyclic nucleotide-binding domain-containing protein [Gammaproteobacteria bacterium]
MTVEIGEDNQVASPQEEFSRDQSEQVCSECEAKRHCLGEGLSEEQMQGLRKITRTLGPFKPGENIFRVEDKFKSLFVIQSGAVKIETASFEGTKLVDGFFFRGDLVGMEAIGAQQYGHDAIALERTLVCELPFDHLESLAASHGE